MTETNFITDPPDYYTGLPVNSVLNDGKQGFFISYNFRDTDFYGCPNTALVPQGEDGIGTNFYILNGDHRKAYAALYEKGFNACLDYFLQNISQKNKYSDTPTVPGLNMEKNS